jgi:hypothetical protein
LPIGTLSLEEHSCESEQHGAKPWRFVQIVDFGAIIFGNRSEIEHSSR